MRESKAWWHRIWTLKSKEQWDLESAHWKGISAIWLARKPVLSSMENERHSWQLYLRHRSNNSESGWVCQELRSYQSNTCSPATHEGILQERKRLTMCGTNLSGILCGNIYYQRNSWAGLHCFTAMRKIKLELWQVYQNRFVSLSVFIKEASSRRSSLFLL